MPYPLPVKNIQIGPHLLYLFMQDDQTPAVKFNDQHFLYLWFLVQQVPELSDSFYIKDFAEISNFFWKGFQFQCVTSIIDYQQHYLEQIELEKKFPSDIFPYRLTDYKIFDVSVMHDPRLEGDRLTYFVYDITTGLPYRVVCPYPYTSTSSLVHYQILPIKEEASFP